MTRKITLSITLIILIIGCYVLIFSLNDGLQRKVASVSQLEASSKELNTRVAQLERKTTTDYEEKKSQLKTATDSYKDAKNEYDTIMAQVTSGDVTQFLATELKEGYDVDFLWTIIGNYATEEGIDLKFDIVRNNTSLSAMNNSSEDYVICDLKFVITGKYINLTDFIYDLEDDDRLNFEINNFEMVKGSENIQVTLTVKEVKVNAKNLLESGVSVNPIDSSGLTEDVQDIDSTTSTENTITNEISSNTTTQVNNNVN